MQNEIKGGAAKIAEFSKYSSAPTHVMFVKGEPVSVIFEATELQRSIQETLQNSNVENVTLIVGDGIWVKEPLTYTVSLN